ncbi:hypothetical protein QSH57_004193 [Fusarium oxysporum f. sp. vasinfectum]|nr:hypothetical protein QSH57_004193 [Fusarium oxysporum f. sp. vasinfectum]
MGFWSSIVNSASQVVHWVSNNAGNIGKVVDIVGKVAGAVALTEEELAAEGNNILPTFYSNVIKAEKALVAKAKDEFPIPNNGADAVIRTAELSGLWPTPGTAKNPKVIPEIAIDINRLLALKRIPTNITGSDGQPVDVGALIAEQLFVPSTKSAEDESPVFCNPVSIVDQKTKKTIIKGGMVSYKLPLGNKNFEAWHSHIRLHHLSSADEERILREERLALAVRPGSTNVKPGAPYNVATLSAQWNGTRAVAPIMSQAIQKLVDDSQGDIQILGPAVIDGSRFKYQFKTSVETGPAEVAAQLSTVLSRSLPEPTGKHPLPRMPTIKVSNIQTFI